MIYSIVKFITIVFIHLLNNYLMKEYPQEYRGYAMAGYLKIMYIFSKAQIKYKQICNFIYNTNPRLISYLNEYRKLKNQNIDNVEFILDGKVIYLTDKEKIVNHIINIAKEDFIIYSDYDSSNSENVCTNKKIITIDSNCSDNDFIYEVSDIKFMLCELYIGDKVYKINLKCDFDKYNYYLVDNIINKKFMIYYLIEFYNEDFSKSIDKFILKLIDHNVNKFEIDITDTSNYIQIKKDGYITN